MGARTPRAGRLAAAALLLGVACKPPPKVDPPSAGGAAAPAATEVTIESAAVVNGMLAVTYRLTDAGAPLDGAAAASLKPTFTLAWLSVEPVSGLPAWRSLILTGTAIPTLPPGGPGTPAAQVMIGTARQPLSESSVSAGALVRTVSLGDGRFTYTFLNALPTDFRPPAGALAGSTLRVGVVLYGVAVGTATTCGTLDFVPNGGALQSWTLVLDENCNACHGLFRIHGNRYTGVKFCATCHTWQHADPDTVDPAAIAPATRATNPNPLELGRMVHRIHRGKKLPTLFKASDWAATNRTFPPVNPLYAGATPWPAAPFAAAPPLPYLNGRNAVAPVGTKFNVIGNSSTEYVYGRIASRIENFQPAKTLAEGVGYPQDLRNCDACHAGAPDRDWIGTGSSGNVAISRRTCSGCHPDVFYGEPDDATLTTPDATHLAHTGGRQVDDAACKDCHVVARSGGPKLYAPIAELHQPLNSRAPNASPRWSRVTGEIVSVENMKAGQLPTVRFKLHDRNGPITPLDHPTTPMDLVAPTSPVPRRMTGLSLVLSGPTSDYVTSGDAVTRATLVTRRSTPPATGSEWWDIAAGFSQVADAQGVFTYTFTTALPSTASGTWAVEIEGRRRPDGKIDPAYVPPADYLLALPAYDKATDTFNWPYTGESISEYLTNDVKFVDVGGTGAITADPARARRAVVDQLKCEKCHLELNLHGANRHDVAACVLCHTPDATDWDKRPRDTRTLAEGGVVGTGMVLLNDPIDPTATVNRWGYATMDGIEERSIHLKTMIHRIHVGEREGAASLEGIRPFAIYGMVYTATGAPNVYFFDDVRFPGDLANCELCHFPNTWTIEAIPAGAAPTTANERPSLRHTGTSSKPAVATHTSTSEPKVLPITAACTSCHTSGAAVDHAAGKTSGGVEQCVSCHGESGADSVRRWHAVP